MFLAMVLLNYNLRNETQKYFKNKNIKYESSWFYFYATLVAKPTRVCLKGVTAESIDMQISVGTT